MSSFLSQTTAMAYLEYAAARLQACGHATEIVAAPATGKLALRVDGVICPVDEVSKLLGPTRPQPTAVSLSA